MSESIRLAATADLAAINDIYNYYVTRSTCTYQEAPSTEAERLEWFNEHQGQFPATVLARSGEVIGWASLSSFRTRRAYRFTVENSVYLRHDLHGQGLGSLLLADLIERAGKLGHHCIMALIDAEQSASVRLHTKFNFVEVGRVKEVGFKFERWLDVVYMQRLL